MDPLVGINALVVARPGGSSTSHALVGLVVSRWSLVVARPCFFHHPRPYATTLPVTPVYSRGGSGAELGGGPRGRPSWGSSLVGLGVARPGDSRWTLVVCFLPMKQNKHAACYYMLVMIKEKVFKRLVFMNLDTTDATGSPLFPHNGHISVVTH